MQVTIIIDATLDLIHTRRVSKVASAHDARHFSINPLRDQQLTWHAALVTSIVFVDWASINHQVTIDTQTVLVGDINSFSHSKCRSYHLGDRILSNPSNTQKRSRTSGRFPRQHQPVIGFPPKMPAWYVYIYIYGKKWEDMGYIRGKSWDMIN